jgi:hypothetical protein
MVPLFPLSLPRNFRRLRSLSLGGKISLEQTNRPKRISNKPLCPRVADCGKKYVITNSRVSPCLAQMQPKKRAFSSLLPSFHFHRHRQPLYSACVLLSALSMEPIAGRPLRSRLENPFQGD